MIRVAPFEELERERYILSLYCVGCDRWGEADLDRLIRSGKGRTRVTEARFRCRDCGAIVEKQLRPPVPASSSAVGYLCLAVTPN